MNKNELILLIDCSSQNVQWGVASKDAIIDKEYLNRESNADSLISKIKKSFDGRSLKFSSVKFVVLANGPGSFTGLRIGSAIAKAICYSTGAKLVEVNSLDIIAEKSATPGNLICLIKSGMKGGEFYSAEYFKDEKVTRISDFKVTLPEEISEDTKIVLMEGTHVENFEHEIVNTETIDSLFKIGLEKIKSENFSDIFTSEPFYIKNFEPVIKIKKTTNGVV